MTEAGSDLATPALLVAMPQVMDPFFHRSVVLLLHHDEEGSFGFIVNRTTGIKVSDILEGMEIEWQGDGEAISYFGGPVQPQLGTVLYGRLAAAEEVPALNGSATEVAPGLTMTQSVGDLGTLADRPPERFRLFLGYAGWGAGQLVDEILRNDWLIAPLRDELVFSPDPESVWDAAVRSVGVDPMTLPAWTPGRGGGATN